jgi:hypothetical protein
MLQLLLPRGLAKAKRETDATAKAFRDGRLLGKAFTASVAESDRLAAAQAFVHSLAAAWWRALTAEDRRPVPLRKLFEPLDVAQLPDWALTVAASLGEEAAALDTNAAAYQIGLAYSGMLNSGASDRAFRCISGSVAVSAYELETLPLPAPELLRELSQLVRAKARRSQVEAACAALYGDDV